VLEAMLLALGARLAPIEAPFDPETAAYGAQGGHSHDR
jgi:urease accessory protein UreE